MQPLPGHYRATEENTSRYTPPGTRVRMVRYDPQADKVYYVRGDNSFTTSAHEFRANFIIDPLGEAAYLNELTALASSLSTLATDLAELESDLSGQHLSLNRADGSVDGVYALMSSQSAEPQQECPVVQTPEEPGAATLVKSTSATHLQKARVTILSIQTRVKATQSLIKEKRDEMQRLAAEALTAANAMIEPIQQYVAKLGEVVTTLELYAGADEVLYTIRSGVPAPENVPLTIRQGVLSMAEEAAVRLHDEGLDARSVIEFAQWVRQDPARIDTFLPEEKGLVALVPTWQKRDYGDPMRNDAMAEANQETYLLIRNGENIYIVATNYHAGRTLTPTQHELQRLFVGSDGERFEPGSSTYLKAERTSTGLQRHYYRIALLLQGLIDRTALFQPLPQDASGARRLSLTGVDDYAAGRIRLIEDVSMALDDERETFAEWQERVNASLEIGRRFVANWHDRCFEEEGKKERVSPRHAYYPNPDDILTAEERKGEYLIARYERTESWRSDSRRASVKVKATDTGIILFDHPDVTPEIMRDFLSRRQARRHYLSMVPLLKLAIEAKEREAALEKPFLDLLIHLGQESYQFTPEQSARHAREAIDAYKQGRKLHTPLPVQDSAAFAACAALMKKQADLQAERREKAANGEFTQVSTELQANHPDAMFIAHIKSREYVVMEPHRQGENIFARIILYKHTRGKLTATETREWRTLPGTWRHHHALHVTPRWEKWDFYASNKHAFTDEEMTKLEQELLRNNPTSVTKQSHPNSSWWEQGELLAISVVSQPTRFHVYRFSEDAGSHRSDKRVYTRVVGFKPVRTRDRILLEYDMNDTVELFHDNSYRNVTAALPWEADGDAPGRYLKSPAGRIIYLNEDQMHSLRRRQEDLTAQAEAASALHKRVWAVLSDLEAAHKAAWWVKQEQKFLSDYGADQEHLWEDHKKSQENLYRMPKEFRNRDSMLYADIELLMKCHQWRDEEGLSVAELASRASVISGKPVWDFNDLGELRYEPTLK